MPLSRGSAGTCRHGFPARDYAEVTLRTTAIRSSNIRWRLQRCGRPKDFHGVFRSTSPPSGRETTLQSPPGFAFEFAEALPMT